ncbi:MAG: type II toxin-antitoxin system VapC family toxin, partial [Nitrososphaeria archaeon]
DKQRAAVDPKLILEPFLDECVKYVVSGVLTIIDVSYDLVIKSSELVLKHHIYMADALQIATAKNVGAGILVTSDGRLAKVARLEGLKVVKLLN